MKQTATNSFHTLKWNHKQIKAYKVIVHGRINNSSRNPNTSLLVVLVEPREEG